MHATTNPRMLLSSSIFSQLEIQIDTWNDIGNCVVRAYVLRSNYRVSNGNEKRAKEGEEEGGDTMTRFCASCGGIGTLAFDDNRRL